MKRKITIHGITFEVTEEGYKAYEECQGRIKNERKRRLNFACFRQSKCISFLVQKVYSQHAASASYIPCAP